MSDFVNDISVPLPPEPPVPRLLLGQKRPRRPGMGGMQPPSPVQAQIPIGTVIPFAGQVISDITEQSTSDVSPPAHPDPLHHVTDPEPMGWMVCDGRALYIAQYPELFEAIGYLYGKGEKSGTFKIPDYRGYFLRGVDNGKYDSEDKARDPERKKRTPPSNGKQSLAVGSTQEDAIQTHAHKYKAVSVSGVSEPGSAAGIPPSNLPLTENGPVTVPGKADVKVSEYESRPKNTYVYFLVKCF